LDEFSRLLIELEKSDASAADDLIWLRCRTDLAFFAAYFFPHYCRYDFNEFHRDVFDDSILGERAVRRVRAAPRGYAKSTITALIKPIHDVCYGLETFIVILSNTQDQADGKLKDIRTEILTNDRLIAVYGLAFPNKAPGSTQYEVLCGKRSCKFEAHGSNVELRGIRYGASRPSKIISDDSEHSEEVNNEEIRTKYEDWYFQVVSNIGDEKTNIEFIGTVLHRESLLMKLLKNPAYDGKLYKAVISWSSREDLWQQWRELYTNLDNLNRLADSDLFYKINEQKMLEGTRVLWPEKEPYLWLMKEMVEKGKRNFMKEKQNEPISNKDSLFDNMQWYREVTEGIQIEKTGVIIPWNHLTHNANGVLDPATGQTKARKGKLGDYACLLTGYQDSKGRLLVHHDWTKRAKPSKQIEQIFELQEQFNYNRFGVETNLYREILLPNIAAEKTRREKDRKAANIPNYGIKVSFYDIEQTEAKDKRIFSIEPKVNNGNILFSRSLSQEFIGMMEAYPTPGHHDDGPDALHMLWSLVNGAYRAKAVDLDPMGGR
jgi:predicted phage terminase large subunit-like protein